MINNRYYPLFYNINEPFYEGMMEVDKNARETIGLFPYRYYKAGFHFWLHKKDAEKVANHIIKNQKRGEVTKRFLNVGIKIITCIVKKSWVITIGTDRTCDHHGKVLVAKKAFFPKFKP